MAGHRDSKSKREERADKKSGQSKSKSKSKSVSSTESESKTGTWPQDTGGEQQEYMPTTPQPDPDPYPPLPPPPKNTQSYRSGFSMPMNPHEQPRSMEHYFASDTASSKYGYTYEAAADQTAQYPPTFESGYSAGTDASSVDTAASGQQQYSYDYDSNMRRTIREDDGDNQN